jgi:hypothetical protein
MVIQQNMARIASFYHAFATTSLANNDDFFNTYVCQQKLFVTKKSVQQNSAGNSVPCGLIWNFL